MIRAGIVGLGRWGQRLVTALGTEHHSHPSSEIQFVKAYARSPAKVEGFCRSNLLQLCASFDELINAPDIDAIVLATPHSQHVDQVRAAAAAGKHVFVEKPFALDLRGAREAVAACRHAEVSLAVGFNRRFLPAYREMDRRLNAGDIGLALHIEGNFSGPFGYSYDSTMWRGTASENPAGGMAAMGIHVLDAMVHLMGEVKSVQVMSTRRVLKAEIDDTTGVALRFRSGATGYLSTLMATASHWRLHLYGAEGWITVNDEMNLECKNLKGETSAQGFPRTDIERLELEAFAAEIAGQDSYPVSASEIFAVTAAFEAISESARRAGESVEVGSVPDE